MQRGCWLGGEIGPEGDSEMGMGRWRLVYWTRGWLVLLAKTRRTEILYRRANP